DRDRSYSMTREQLTEDINALWLMRQYFPDKATKAEIAPIAELSEDELASLLDRLVNPEIRLLRRAIPFPQWAYIFNNQKLRTELIVNRFIHSTVLTYIRSSSDDKIGEIRNKQFTNQELAAVAEQLNNIYQTEDEDEHPFSGEEVLQDFIELDTEKEIEPLRRGESSFSYRLEDDEDELETIIPRGGTRGDDIRLEEDLDEEVDLLDLAEELFKKLKGIWSSDRDNDD
ncbi:MAG: DUF1822 family protein, partial [Pleurocapsa sp. CRU_1_2]|nr:DUF1822 family protein [Pleurocapsa sp. CRU_1_2]